LHPSAAQRAQHVSCWRELDDTLAALRLQNELNGRLVHSRLHHTSRALAILRGQTDQADSYSPSGALTGAAPSGRSVISV
jgi:flagellar biosynthesis/type III secretory pathway chaperone